MRKQDKGKRDKTNEKLNLKKYWDVFLKKLIEWIKPNGKLSVVNLMLLIISGTLILMIIYKIISLQFYFVITLWISIIYLWTINQRRKRNEINERLDVKTLILLFLTGVAISISLYLMFQFNVLKLGTLQDTPLQSYLVIIAGIPTIYLWIINQRKKEKQIDISIKDQLNETTREMQERYVSILTKFDSDDQFMAKCYALRGLIDDWYLLPMPDLKQKQIYMNQLALILFNFDRTKIHDENIKKLYISLLEETLKTSLHMDKIKYSNKLINFKDLNLSDFELKDTDLSYANLSEMDLTAAFLTNANLSYANLSGTILFFAHLTNANLSEADLTAADLTTADLKDANLSHVILTKAVLRGAHLSNAKLVTSNLSEADLSSSDLIGADLTGVNLSNTDLISADLTYADLTYADLTGANLTDANLSGANLSNTDLTGVDLSSVNLTETYCYIIDPCSPNVDIQ